MRPILWAFLAVTLSAGHVSWAASQKDASAVDLRSGAYSLFVALGAVDLAPPTFQRLESELGQPTKLGYSMQQLGDAASAFKAYTLGVETTLDRLEIREGRFACIALLEDQGHFVCIYDVDDLNVYLVDPPGHRVVPREVFAKLWAGKALLVSDRPIDNHLPTSFSKWLIVPAVGAAIIVLVYVILMARSRR